MFATDMKSKEDAAALAISSEEEIEKEKSVLEEKRALARAKSAIQVLFPKVQDSKCVSVLLLRRARRFWRWRPL